MLQSADVRLCLNSRHAAIFDHHDNYFESSKWRSCVRVKARLGCAMAPKIAPIAPVTPLADAPKVLLALPRER